ncbi:hypothetical protein P4200_30775 [Pseudomonas aeruginosa]|nr:hypothetical protein [Pseudomonas aeruginosa]
MTDQLAKAMQPAVKDWSEQLRALVDNATSLDELQGATAATCSRAEPGSIRGRHGGRPAGSEPGWTY